jgi:hypothetical protein
VAGAVTGATAAFAVVGNTVAVAGWAMGAVTAELTTCKGRAAAVPSGGCTVTTAGATGGTANTATGGDGASGVAAGRPEGAATNVAVGALSATGATTDGTA